MNDPYKIAENILSTASAVPNSFSSVDLYGSSVQIKDDDLACSVFHIENESGTGDITVYQAFPGIELIYNDMHWEYCKKTQDASVVFDHVSFSYPGAEEKALDDVSFELPAGKTVALVGASGSGKSTAAGLIPRFYDVQEGSVQTGGAG